MMPHHQPVRVVVPFWAWYYPSRDAVRFWVYEKTYRNPMSAALDLMLWSMGLCGLILTLIGGR